LRDGEKRILKKLVKFPHGLSFTQIKKELSLSSPVISDYLKPLQKEGYIIKNVDTRKYSITPKGQSELKKLEGIERVETSGTLFTSTSPGIYVVPNPTPLSVKSFGHPFTKERVVIDGYLSLDNQHKDMTESVLKQLEKTGGLDFIPDFFNKMGEALSKQDDNYPSENLFKKPTKSFKTRIKEEKAKLDFEASILLIFNGKEVADKIDWDEQIKNANEYEEREEKNKKQCVKELDGNKEHRKAWLKSKLLDYLKTTTQGNRFLRFFETSSSQKELESKTTNEIVECLGLPKTIRNIEISVALEELGKEGKLRVLPVTKYFYELDNEKDEKKDSDQK
jgi:predicted transcriptional regulator